jgi:protein-tyrosine phosphatase
MNNNESIIASVQNFREMGGIKAGERVIKQGKLFRSGSLTKLDDEAKHRFDKLGIDYIFDYRSVEEVTLSPDYTGSSEYFHLPAIGEMPGNSFIEKIKARNKGVIPADMHSSNPADMASLLNKVTSIPFVGMKIKKDFGKMYERMPFQNAAFAATFEKMTLGATILIHCQTGKDRTGVAAALILLALGADERTVIDDYMVSNRYRERENSEAIRQVYEITGSRRAVGIIETIMINREAYIIKALSAIKKVYRHIDDFFLNEYGVDKHRMDLWRYHYLE